MIIKSFDIVSPKVQSIKTTSPIESRKRNNRRYPLKILVIILPFLAGLLIGGLYVNFTSHKKSVSITDTTTDIQQVLTAVRYHMDLPADETPALATVTDSTKLNTPLLKAAKNGDKILIYQKHTMAIIYRPVVDRIIGFGTVTIDTPPTPQN